MRATPIVRAAKQHRPRLSDFGAAGGRRGVTGDGPPQRANPNRGVPFCHSGQRLTPGLHRSLWAVVVVVVVVSGIRVRVDSAMQTLQQVVGVGRNGAMAPADMIGAVLREHQGGQRCGDVAAGAGERGDRPRQRAERVHIAVHDVGIAGVQRDPAYADDDRRGTFRATRPGRPSEQVWHAAESTLLLGACSRVRRIPL